MKNYLFLLFVFCFLFVLSVSTPAGAATQVCTSIASFGGTANDASGAIQACINSAAANDVVELPAGKYYVAHQIRIESNPITLRTQGKDGSMARCSGAVNDCAEIVASVGFDGFLGIVQVLQNGTTIDHIVLNGNKSGRASSVSASKCRSSSNGWGYNMRAHISNFSLTNSINKNALCGTGLEMSGTNNKILNNLFTSNGVHNANMMWADGLTVHNCNNCVFQNNEFFDGTDIDLIFGGCQNCSIKNNTIRHSDYWSGASFAGLMLHAWPGGSGNYTGTEVTGNTIDCGAKKRCGFGLYLGAHGWYQTMSYGGSIHDNTIANSQQGLVIDDFYGAQVYNNPVSNVSGNKYTIGTQSRDIDQSKDTIGTVFKSVNWDGHIPNMSCANDCNTPANGAKFVSQSVPSQMAAGQTYSVLVTMENTGTNLWTAASNYKLGSQNVQDNSTWGTGRVDISYSDSISNGNTKTFAFNVKAPATPGIYNFQWQMLQEGMQWFGGKSTNVAVAVTAAICIPTCTTAGARQCSGSSIQTCALSGGCLKWGAAVACETGKTCSDDECKTACVPKTCATLGNYQCGSWSNGCGTNLNCGTCAIGKTCSNGNCVSRCTSHVSKKCDSGKLYWYNSCNAKEGLAQDCGNDQLTSIYRCNGSWTQRETIKKVCSNNACASESAWIDNTDCAASGKTCSNGVCIAACTNECTSGAKQCSGATGFKTCAAINGCLKWGAAANCPAGQTCSGAGVCAVNGSVSVASFDVLNSDLEAMGCGDSVGGFKHQSCRAKRWCVSKGYATGIQTEWGVRNGIIQCISITNNFDVSNNDLEAMGCGDDPNGFKHQACRAKRWCASKGYAMGIQTEWQATVGTIQCVSAASSFNVSNNDLEAMGCGDDPNGFKHQWCRAKRWCASKGYATGFQTEWGVSSGGIFCLGEKVSVVASNNTDLPSSLQASLALIKFQIESLIARFSIRQ